MPSGLFKQFFYDLTKLLPLLVVEVKSNNLKQTNKDPWIFTDPKSLQGIWQKKNSKNLNEDIRESCKKLIFKKKKCPWTEKHLQSKVIECDFFLFFFLPLFIKPRNFYAISGWICTFNVWRNGNYC